MSLQDGTSTTGPVAGARSQTRSFNLGAPSRELLQLFTAEGERLWVPGWNPELLSGGTERGSVFRTLGADGQETVWVVTDFRPDLGRASYARIAQGSNMGLVDVHCEPLTANSTCVTVTYTLTGLSPEGTAFVQRFLAAQYFSAYIEGWKQSLDNLLESGQ